MEHGPDPRPPAPDPRRFDPGWLFLLSGAILISTVVLIPPADDLAELHHRRDRLVAREREAVNRLAAYSTFLEALDHQEPDLVHRLATSQLNMTLDTTEPLGLFGAGLDAQVDRWIEATLPPPDEIAPPAVKNSALRRISRPHRRLWAILAGAILIFIGLLPPTRVEPTPTPGPDV